MSRRYLIAIENNKMFVAWWMNPFNIDMEGVATWTPLSYCFASLIFYFMLRKLLFFYINMFIWGFILNKTFFSYNVEHLGFSFVEILLCLTDGNVICESYVV